MKIKQLMFSDFKRFTNLTVTDIPETTKLVVLVGPNGSGKSSIFDGFNLYASRIGNLYSPNYDYYGKAGGISLTGHWDVFENRRVVIVFHDSSEFQWNSPTDSDKTKFYIRTGYRYQPDFKISSLNAQGPIEEDGKRPKYLMAIEGRVSSNYERLISQTINSIFSLSDDTDETKEQLRERIIGKIRDSYARVLPDAKLIGFGNPLADGSFYFKKGNSTNWPFKNLSAGEKAVFDLVLDFAIKSEVYNNTIYCIDEPEVHINTNVHSALLNELYNSLPGKSQLWIATHSAGMMRKARELEEANPGTVVFLDFGEKDFDQPVTLRPAITDRQFWKRNFSVALGELAELIAPTRIFVCEGDPSGRKKREFDARCYSAIFFSEFPDAVFISVGGSNEVKDKANFLSGIFSQFLPGIHTTFIIDRDDCTESERLVILQQGNKILERRHLEAYMLDDEILAKFCFSQGKPDIWPTLRIAKEQLLSASKERGNPSDDWKSIAESIRTTAKTLLGITQIGSNADAFILEYLAPQTTPDTTIYQILKREIFN